MKNIFLIFVVAIFFAGCAMKSYDYSALQSSNPKSILVLMPANQTNEINASASILANSIYPLAEAGYYVFSPTLTYAVFKNNGISEAEDIAQIPLAKIKEIFGADSLMYIDVLDYGTKYLVIDSQTIVHVKAKLVDLNSGVLLWDKETAFARSSGGGGSVIINMIASLISQVVSEETDYAYDLSAITLNMLLFGKDCNDCLLRGERSLKFRQDAQLTTNN